MNEKYKKQLEDLAELLVTPERIGKLAMAELYTPVELDLIRNCPDSGIPESGPLPLSTEHTLERLDRLGKLA